MTYCAALKLDKSLVFMSDTRTNAGVDNVAKYRKMFTWTVPGDRVITLMTAGNLATTQSLVSLLNERSVIPEDRKPNILREPTMFQVARLVGNTVKELIGEHRDAGYSAEAFGATLILGGQIGTMEPRLFMIYSEGNFVEAGAETPFFQIGETKYGRPIIVRAMDTSMSDEDAVRLLCVSFDSTIKANLSVGMPLDVHIYKANSLKTGPQFRIADDDPGFASISAGWSDALKAALDGLPYIDIPTS